MLFTAFGMGSASAGTIGIDWDGTQTAIQGLAQLANGFPPDEISAHLIAMWTLTASAILGIIRRIMVTILAAGAVAEAA